MIPIYLSQEVQGYWFSFISLAALRVFADLGFSVIIQQFTSHEFAFVDLDKDGVCGSNKHVERLAGLFTFSIKWALKLSLIAFPLISAIGFYIMDNTQTEIVWVVPWIIYSLSSVLTFVLGVVFSFIQGHDKVGDINRIQMYSGMAYSVLLVLFMFFDFGLYSLSFALIISQIVSTYILYKKYGRMIKFYMSYENKFLGWGDEIKSLMFKYAISWSSGYFIFQIFTPLVFYMYGPVFAGKVGFTLSVFQALFGLSTIWVVIVTPKINILISKGLFDIAKKEIIKHTIFSMFTYLLGVIAAALCFVYVFPIMFDSNILIRLTSVTSIMMLSFFWFFQVMINSFALYIRSYKQEPFVYTSVFGAVYTTLGTYFTLSFLGEDYVYLSLLTSIFFLIPMMIYIYKKNIDSYMNLILNER